MSPILSILLGLTIFSIGVLLLISAFSEELKEVISKFKQEADRSYISQLKEKFNTGVEVKIDTGYVSISDEHYVVRSEYQNANMASVLKNCKIVGWADEVLFVRELRPQPPNLIKPTDEKDTVTLFKVENIYDTEKGGVTPQRVKNSALELKNVCLSKRNNIQIEASNATINATISSIDVHDRRDNLKSFTPPNNEFEPSKEVYSINVTESLAKQILYNHKITNSVQIRHRLAILEKRRNEVIDMEGVYNEEMSEIEKEIKEQLRA